MSSNEQVVQSGVGSQANLNHFLTLESSNPGNHVLGGQFDITLDLTGSNGLQEASAGEYRGTIYINLISGA
ncbi:MAG: hypothetical protein VB025_15685 [Sphaerochaeta sp.]|nr:hypothetical protein [Sphaerochaeta sp.]